MKLNPYRKEWSRWLPQALEALAQDPPDYGSVMPHMPLPAYVEVPPAPVRGPLRLAILSTSGAYDTRSQPAFAASSIVGDPTHRVLDMQTPDEAVAFAHEHYDRSAAREDCESVIPRRTLRALGVELTGNIISWSGFLLDWPTSSERCITRSSRFPAAW